VGFVETALGIRLLVVRETDTHAVSGDLLQKRPLSGAVRPSSTRCPISEYGIGGECAIGKSGFFFAHTLW
jgi:hypothetical protein